MNFGALSRGFGTCCLRFKNDVATIPARLTSGWLARLCREGVDPLDRYKRFQIAVSSSFSGFILAQGKFHGIPSLELRRRDALHSALMLAALMIGHHLSISASWRARSLSGACSSRGTTWSPRSTSRWRVAGAARASTIAALSLPMTCFGVPFGAQIALQTEV